jgi:CRISPR-associated protein Csd1
MILQALTRYYDILSKNPESDIAPPGYSTANVSFALNISRQGELLDVFPLFVQVQRGKKMEEKPRRMIVPEQVKRSSGISPNFLCDNNAYVLGISEKDTSDPDYGVKRFEAFRQFHKDLLANADCDAARSVVAFLDGYKPNKGRQHPAIAVNLETLLKGGNLVFMFCDGFVNEDATIRQVWDTYKAGNDTIQGQCLVTGETAPIARLHASLKGIRDANPTGASLVGFNARAYESYNRVNGQGLNSPVSEKATFAYTTSLNYLLSSSNPNKKFFVGDTTVVYWAESENKEYAAAFEGIFAPEYVEEPVSEFFEQKKANEHIGKIADKVRARQALDMSRLREGLDDSTRFYVLGLAPNAARISVRFFLADPFGKIIDRIMQHYSDLEIVKEFDNQPTYVTAGHILAETISKKVKDPKASPLMAGSVFRAILANTPYPAALYYAILNRIRADVDDKEQKIFKINHPRAAVIKAFLIRKYRNQSKFKEVLVMSLNEQSTIPAYALGRLFAVLEKVQQEAIGDVNASIKDRYFTSACASPASVFPVLLRLSQHHISKAKYGYASDRRIQDILGLLDVEMNPIPARLTLDEQGVFVLGYYHQRAAFYVSKTEKNDTEDTLFETEKLV